MRNFRKFDFWPDSKELSVEIIKLLRTFPKEEQFALCNQLRRASVSIVSNIAEGTGRDTDADFAHFIDIAMGSAYEVETQIEISKDLGYISDEIAEDIIERLQSIERRLSAFVLSLRNRQR